MSFTFFISLLHNNPMTQVLSLSLHREENRKREYKVLRRVAELALKHTHTHALTHA